MPTAGALEVVDASAPAALLFGEPEAERVAARLGSARLMAPALLEFELANIWLTKLRRHLEQRDAILRALALRDRTAVEIMAVGHDGTVATGGDLWLAQRLGAGLVTLDRQLTAAMVPLLG